ncbi:MAG: RhuM family protein [Ignavibacteriaceae bacterium]
MPEKKTEEIKKGEIALYKTGNNEIELQVQLKDGSVWLKQDEIAKLYGRDRSVITKHINKIFTDKEVDKKSNVHFLHIANSDKPVAFYSLDMILAVGYRTNSSRAIHFRRWATEVLKKYLIDGFAINQKRLESTRNNLLELTETIEYLKDKSKHELLAGQEQEILSLLSNYSKSFSLLEQYDKDKLSFKKKEKENYEINYEDASGVI